MTERRPHPAAPASQSRSGIRPRPIFILLAVFTFLAALLAAAALTYGWDALTRAFHAAPTLPFAARAALSTVLVFLGAFALTSLWLPSATRAPIAEAVAVPALVKVPAAEDEWEDGADPLPSHIPVRAADLPRILFDTGEFPTVAANDESGPNRPAQRVTKPLAWPQHILPPDWPDD